MAFTPSLIGSATGQNVASLSISVPAAGVAAGSKIYLVQATSGTQISDASPSDSAGNVYNMVGGGISGAAQVRIFEVDNALALAHNQTITIAPASGTFSGRIAAFSASGLNQGTIDGSSAGEGTDTTPLATLPNVPAGDWCVGIVGVSGPSADGFTQATGWSNPGNLNTQTTTDFSVYAGFFHAVSGGAITYNPMLGVSRDFVCVVVSLTP